MGTGKLIAVVSKHLSYVIGRQPFDSEGFKITFNEISRHYLILLKF
jgi:hypothetical protein